MRPKQPIELIPDPVEWLRSAERSSRTTTWRWIGTRPHSLWRVVEGNGHRFRSKVNFDDRWDCETCRPYKESKEGDRILAAFESKEMHVAVVPTDDLATVIRRIRDTGAIKYCAFPATSGHQRAILVAASGQFCCPSPGRS